MGVPNEDKKMDAEDIKEWMTAHHMEDAKVEAAGKGKHIFKSCGMAHGRSKNFLKNTDRKQRLRLGTKKRTRKYVCIAVSI